MKHYPHYIGDYVSATRHLGNGLYQYQLVKETN